MTPRMTPRITDRITDRMTDHSNMNARSSILNIAKVFVYSIANTIDILQRNDTHILVRIRLINNVELMDLSFANTQIANILLNIIMDAENISLYNTCHNLWAVNSISDSPFIYAIMDDNDEVIEIGSVCNNV